MYSADGQGNQDPPNLFGVHCFVRIGSDYYDPSYGGQVYTITIQALTPYCTILQYYGAWLIAIQ